MLVQHITDMVRKGLTFFLVSIACIFMQKTLYAQQTKVDSLLNVISTAGEDSNKVNTYNQLAKEILFTTGEYDKAIEYAIKGAEVAHKIEFKKGEALAYNITGAAYMFQGKYTEALANYNISLQIKESIGDKKGIAGAYSNIGLVYMYQGKYPDALQNFKSSLKMEEELGDKAGMAGSYNNIGIVYEDLGNYPEALNNYLESVKLKQEVGDKSGLANTVSNIGVIKEIQKNYKEALQYHRFALDVRKQLEDKRGIADCYNNIGNCNKELGRYTEALGNQKQSLKIYEEIGNPSGAANAYNNIGQIYNAQGDSAINHNNELMAHQKFSEAMVSYKHGLGIRIEIGDQTGIAASYHNMGSVSMKLKENANAEKYLKESLKVALSIGYKKTIKDGYKELSALDSTMGKMGAAFENYKMFIVYRDSLFNEENAEKSYATQMQYEIETKEKEAQRVADAEKKRVEEENTRQYLIIFVIVFLVVLGVLLLGRVKIPTVLAEAMTFVSLLLVFESVLVFTDPYLDVYAQGAPYKKLLINILMAILIFPIHHLVENRFKKRLKINKEKEKNENA